MEPHENDDNNDHFYDMEGQKADIRDGEKGLSHYPFLCHGLDCSCAFKGKGPLIAGIVVGSLVYEKYACEARWRNSGRKTSWGLMQRCLVENDQGILVPERAIRFMEDR